MKAGDVSASVEQFSEGRLADSRSMLDLPVDGLKCRKRRRLVRGRGFRGG